MQSDLDRKRLGWLLSAKPEIYPPIPKILSGEIKGLTEEDVKTARQAFAKEFFAVIQANKDRYFCIKDHQAMSDDPALELKRLEFLQAIKLGNKTLATVSPKYKTHLMNLREAIATEKRKALALQRVVEIDEGNTQEAASF